MERCGHVVGEEKAAVITCRKVSLNWISTLVNPTTILLPKFDSSCAIAQPREIGTVGWYSNRQTLRYSHSMHPVDVQEEIYSAGGRRIYRDIKNTKSPNTPMRSQMKKPGKFQRHQTTLWVNLTVYNSMPRYQLNSSSQNKARRSLGHTCTLSCQACKSARLSAGSRNAAFGLQLVGSSSI